MSGGVDSTAALIRLLQKGYQVQGLTLQMWRRKKDKNLQEAAAKSQSICNKLGVRHTTLDISAQFKDLIVDRFVDEYLAGRTPNPCVDCNPRIKWRHALEFADQEKITYIATGHYCRVNHDPTLRRLELLKGIDPGKDQSYMLWQLPQHYLQRTLFPLGELHKTATYELTAEMGLSFAAVGESQDVCFLPDNDYRRFLEEYVPQRLVTISKGELVDEVGKVLGTHHGFYNFTIGQRKGFRMGFGERRYVKSINAGQNRVTIAADEGLLARSMSIERLNWVSLPPESNIAGQMKVRYRHPGSACRLHCQSKTECRVDFEVAERALTPGQSAVLYQDQRLILGGIIKAVYYS
jgi:tRNA-specific 2-thiouridylase